MSANWQKAGYKAADNLIRNLSNVAADTHSLQRVVRRWVAMHSAYSNKEEYDQGWRFVRNRQEISLYIKVQGIENAKWLARQLNKAEAPNEKLSHTAPTTT